MSLYFDPFRELDRMASTMLDNAKSPRRMPLDLHREADTYVLTMDLPGIDPASIDIDVDGQLLTVRAESTPRNTDVQWIANERPVGSYLRQLSLGDGIDIEKISANYTNGVLSVLIPVTEKAKPRKIEVSTEAPSEPLRVEASEQRA